MRSISLTLAFFLTTFVGTTNIKAQEYPSRTIRIIVPSGPGGTLDVIARIVGQELHDSLKVPVIVDNRPGANGIIALTYGARAAPDGYTITMATTGSFVMNFVARKSPPFHPVNDFIPVSLVAESDYILLVHPSVPVKNLKEFIALAKSKPTEISYSSFGPGSVSHVIMESFALATGIKMLHVPYKSGPDALQGVVAGQVQASFDTPLIAISHVRDNRLRALAIGSTKRSAIAPEIPTFAEAGLPGFSARAWFGWFVPSNTPAEITRKLQTEIAQALANPVLHSNLEKLGLTDIGGTPEQLSAQIKADIKLYGQVARETNIHLD